MTNIIELPLEIFHEILKYLDSKTIYTLCLINRAHYLYYYPFLFHNVKIDTESKLDSFIKSLNNKEWKNRKLGGNTKILQFDDIEMSFEELMYIQSQCGHVNDLTVDYETWQNILENELNHSQGRLDHDVFYDILIQSLNNYSQLSILTIGLVLGMPNTVTFQHIFECLPNLKDLSLENINLMEMTDFEIIHQCCPLLETLSFDGFCLLRKKPTPPIKINNTLRSLKIKFSSGWSVYWDWLAYIGNKYARLDSLICICPTSMGVRNLSESVTDVRESCDVFAKNHSRHLKRLELINLNLDITFFNALLYYATDHNHRMIESNQQQLFNIYGDESSSSLSSSSLSDIIIPPLSPPYNCSSALQLTTEIKEFSVTTSSSDDSIAKFKTIIEYIHHSVERLSIFSPTVDPNAFEVYHLLHKCIHLTDLSLYMPHQQRFFSDFDIDIILSSCPQLTQLYIKHGNLITMDSVLTSFSLTSSSRSTKLSKSFKSSSKKKKIITDHPLRKLILDVSYLRNQNLSANFNLCHLQILKINDCSILYPSKLYNDNYYLKMDMNLIPFISQHNNYLPISIFINKLVFNDLQGMMSLPLRQIIIDENETNKQQIWAKGLRTNSKWKKTKINPRRSDRIKAKKDFHDPFTKNSAQLTIKCQQVKTITIDDERLV